MSYIVLDEKGVGYSDDSGVITIPKGQILEDKLIEKGLFRQSGIDYMLQCERIAPVGKQASPIAPDNMKMPEVQTKVTPKPRKSKGGK